MNQNFLKNVILLTLLCFIINSFKIIPDGDPNAINSETNSQILSESKDGKVLRCLQSFSLNEQTSTISFQEQLLTRFNLKRKQLNLPELKIDMSVNSTLTHWTLFFQKSYTLENYLTLLGGFASSKILEFSNFQSQDQLIASILDSSIHWISIKELKIFGFFIQIIQGKNPCFVVFKDVENDQTVSIEKIDSISYNPNKLVQIIAVQQNVSDQKITINNSNQNQSITQKISISISPDISSSSNFLESNKIQNLQQKVSINPPAGTLFNPKISNTQFNGIILYHEIPLTLSNQQIFAVKGRVLQPALTNDGLFVSFFFKKTTADKSDKFYTWLGKGVSQFTVFLDLNKLNQGQYEFASLVGTNFTISPKRYTITSKTSISAKLQNAPPKPNGLNIDFKDNKLYFNWQDRNSTSIYIISFQQGNKIIQYTLSNYQSTFQVPFKDFGDFTLEKVTVNVVSAYSSSLSLSGRISEFSQPVTLQFNPTHHHFDLISEQQISLNKQIPYIIKVNESIVIDAKAQTYLQNKIILQQPSKTFGIYFFNEANKSQTITPGRFLNKQIKLTQEGVYILEVNNVNGVAVINRPIYVGNQYPLLPDFEDLREKNVEISVITQGQPKTLNEQRALFLRLVNQKRKQFGVNQIVSDSQLDALAQLHTDDMVARGYFRHNDPSGQGPQQRAAKMGITQGVGQNIAKDVNLTDAHYRLCRSPAHLMNIVKKDWLKVGFGISMDSSSYFYIAQQFAGRDYSKNPLTDLEMSPYRMELESLIRQTYKSIQRQNPQLSSALKDWQNLSESAKNTQSITAFMRSKGLSGFYIGNIKVYYTEDFVQIVKQNQYLTSSKPNPASYGLTLKMVDGWIEIFYAYT